MMDLLFDRPRRRALKVLCLGAHCDDVDIGCGGTLLRMIAHNARVDVTWAAFSGDERRTRELNRSAARFLRKAAAKRVVAHGFRDGFFPAEYAGIKEAMNSLRDSVDPDLIFTHHLDDRHQDHRVVGELTWTVFRRHLIAEYEIPKYDAGLPPPNAYMRLTKPEVETKIRILTSCYVSQRSKPWFSEDTFRGLMRLRGIEAGAAEGWAEAFHLRKLSLA